MGITATFLRQRLPRYAPSGTRTALLVGLAAGLLLAAAVCVDVLAAGPEPLSLAPLRWR